MPDYRPKWAKCVPVFQTKTAQKPYPMARHIPACIWLIYGTTPPLPGDVVRLVSTISLGKIS